MEEEPKTVSDPSKLKPEDKLTDSKDTKSRDRDRDDHKKSKKHKKRRSRSPSDESGDSRSRSKTRSHSKKTSHHKKHKSKRSRSRSPRKRSHSRSRKHRSHRRSRSRSKSKDRRDRDREKDRGGDRRRRDSPDRRKPERSEKPKEAAKDSRKGFKFDSPPKEMQMSEEGINFAALGIPNLEVLKEMYPALKNMDPSELINKLRLIEDLKGVQASKVDRKLYIGNIPAGITPQMLMDLLNSALQKMGINVEPTGNSIIGAWISPDNHYAFVDFRTPEEATNGFALNSVAIHGQTLKVGRPRSYQQTQSVENPLQALLGSAGLPLNPLGMLGQGEGTMSIATKIQPPSRILVLKNMAKVSELEIDEEYSELTEDVKDECGKLGKVLSLKIPRPEKGKTVAGLGKVFVEYSSIDEAKAARKELHGRTFDESTVEVSYYDEAKYAENDLSEV